MTFDAKKAVATFRKTFRAAGNPVRAEGEKKYLKSDLRFYGATKPVIRNAAREFCLTNPDLPREDVIGLVRALWQTDWHELRSVGIALLERRVAQLRAGDISLVEELLRKSETWAYVDWLAVDIAGHLVSTYRSSRRVLSRWSADDYMWVRRASMLALLNSLKKNGDDFADFARFAKSMLSEREFFIRKAIGWVLREVGKRRPDEAYRFLKKNVKAVSGLTLREGMKYLPVPQRRELLGLYQSNR